jgi:hypothetical protein
VTNSAIRTAQQAQGEQVVRAEDRRGPLLRRQFRECGARTLLISTLETVPTQTPACAATSLMLAGASATVPSRIWCKCAVLIWNVSNIPPRSPPSGRPAAM